MVRAAAAGLALLGALVLLLPPGAADSFPVPGTPVELIELGPYAVVLAPAGSHSFTWGLLNGGNATALDLNATASDPRFSVTADPTNLTLSPGEFRQVFVNVTAPGETLPGAIQIELRVRAAGNTTFLARTAMVRVEPASAVPDPIPALLAAGSIIVIGFAASLLFERTKVPEHLFLIVLGLVLGPIAAGLLGIVVVPQDTLAAVTPYLTALALMIILFDGGLNLSFASLRGRVAITLAHTLAAFVGTVVLVAYLASIVLGYPLEVGFLLGGVLGGISGAVVIGLVRRMSLSEETKALLTLEAALTDVLGVVVVLATIDYIAAGPGHTLWTPLLSLARSLSLAVPIGAVTGLAMLFGLLRLEEKPYGFMLSIGVLLILYAVVEQLGGNGPMAAFSYGLVLGNRESFAKALRGKVDAVSDRRFKQFHGEITFLMRTFFFVFLGLAFTIPFGGPWTVQTSLPGLSLLNGTFGLLLAGVLLLFLAIAGVRVGVAAATNYVLLGTPRERTVLMGMMDRGLTAAVLASLPFTVAAFTSPVHPGYAFFQPTMAPFRSEFLVITVFVILLTLAVTTAAVVRTERQARRETPEEGGGEEIPPPEDQDWWSALPSDKEKPRKR